MSFTYKNAPVTGSRSRVKRIGCYAPGSSFAPFVVALFLSACGIGRDAANSQNLNPTSDQMTILMEPIPSRDPDPDIIVTSRIQEDFDSRRQLAKDGNSNVTVDVNQGLVFLPAIKLPQQVENSIPAAAPMRVTEYKGSIESEHILIEDHVSIEGTDSVELTAADSIRVTGDISAGNGGITLIANNSIHIDGTLRSTGPIRLRVTQALGNIVITGTVNTLSTEETNSADINILTRGTVDISGTLKTGDTRNASSGNIEIVSYGEITITRNTTKVETGDTQAGNAGNILLSTESTLQITDGSSIKGGKSVIETARDESINAGHIQIRVQELHVGESVRMTGGDCLGCDGGQIDVIAAQSFKLVKFVELHGGQGKNGGDVSLRVGSAEIGKNSLLKAGAGTEHAGRVFIDTPDDLEIGSDARIQGGSGHCSEGGPVVGLVGKTLKLNSGSWIKGGTSLAYNEECIGASRGGDIQIFCKDVEGYFEYSSRPGEGSPAGTSTLRTNPKYERPAAISHPETSGYLDSKVFDRGIENINMFIDLDDEQAELPEGTRIDVLLCGALDAEGPFSAWLPADSKGTWSEDFNSFRFVKYRVALHGRALDTPVLDRFEIDLASTP